MRTRHLMFVALLFAVVVPAYALADDEERIIIKAAKPYDSVVAAVQKAGGHVDFKYENIDAVAARVPKRRVPDITALAGVKVVRDALVAVPRPVRTKAIPGKPSTLQPIVALSAQVLQGSALAGLLAGPNDYAFNNILIGATPLHQQGKIGQDVTVAIIDTGTANSPVVPSIAGNVIGGENFVTADPVQSATSRRNHPHGTWVGTVIASHVIWGIPNTTGFVRALKNNGPNLIVGPCPNAPPTVLCGVPMIGVAPGAKLYALKVFASSGGSAPDSRVIAAMDRAITLRRNFNNGMSTAPVSGDGTEDNPYKYNALPIQVVNMSLGGPTLFPGRDLEDLLTLEMLKVGITIAAAAGNDGFAAMTVGSPGSGMGSLTVGAASTATHERILYDLLGGVGFGALFRASSHIQTAWFSSRGPNSDGRSDPDLVANGDDTFAQGTCSGNPGCLAGTQFASLDLVSGTSFSSPTVAGAAALLRGAVSGATATQVRNALIASANPSVLGDGSSTIDQGHGMLNVSAGYMLLKSGGVSPTLPPTGDPDSEVRGNLATLGFQPVSFSNNVFSTRVANLRPGHVAQFFVLAKRNVDRLVVTLRNVTPELPPAQQNQLFGDDVFIQVADAPTSFLQPLVFDFVPVGSSYTIDNPQSGFVRVALQGDWTNAGKVSLDLEIRQTTEPLGPETAQGDVGQGDFIPVAIRIPAGTKEADFSLFWDKDWASFPTNDIDLYLVDPSGAVNFDGATLRSPEMVTIKNPAAGMWTAYISGFTVNGDQGERDGWQLRVTLDGVRLKK
jgi:hypothetical protein